MTSHCTRMTTSELFEQDIKPHKPKTMGTHLTKRRIEEMLRVDPNESEEMGERKIVVKDVEAQTIKKKKVNDIFAKKKMVLAVTFLEDNEISPTDVENVFFRMKSAVKACFPSAMDIETSVLKDNTATMSFVRGKISVLRDTLTEHVCRALAEKTVFCLKEDPFLPIEVPPIDIVVKILVGEEGFKPTFVFTCV